MRALSIRLSFWLTEWHANTLSCWWSEGWNVINPLKSAMLHFDTYTTVTLSAYSWEASIWHWAGIFRAPSARTNSSLLIFVLLCLLASFFDCSACYKDGKNKVCFNLSSVSHLPRLELCSSTEREKMPTVDAFSLFRCKGRNPPAETHRALLGEKRRRSWVKGHNLSWSQTNKAFLAFFKIQK